jgi:hypothetical protein
VVLEIVGVEEEARAGFFRIEGRHLALELVALLLQELDELGAGFRHLVLRNQLGVVGQRQRLDGGAVGKILVDGPIRQVLRLGRCVGLRVAVGDELDLRVHGVGPDEVGAHLVGGRLADHPVVGAVGAEIVELDLDLRIALVEGLGQLLHLREIGGRIDDHLALFLGVGDQLGIIGGIAGRNALGERRPAHRTQSAAQDDAASRQRCHCFLPMFSHRLLAPSLCRSPLAWP